MSPYYPEDLPAFYLLQIQILLGGGLSGYVKSKPLGNRQIISIDAFVIVMIIAIFHRKLI